MPALPKIVKSLLHRGRHQSFPPLIQTEKAAETMVEFSQSLPGTSSTESMTEPKTEPHESRASALLGNVMTSETIRTMEEKLKFVASLRNNLFLVLWILWLLFGTLWYTYAGDLGYAQGFYQAVNIGYSIGFGYPYEEKGEYLWFSSVYVIIGASFVAVALGFFGDKIGEDYGSWFTQQKEHLKYESAKKDMKYWKQVKYWFNENSESVRPVILWLVWIGIMIAYSMIELGWSFTEAQYFAISTCSTGGHWPIDETADDWLFVVTGIFAALGVPLMAIAMASIGRGLVNFGDIESTKATILEDITAEELAMMTSLGLEDGNFKIERAEFIILCMMRVGTEPELIQFISDQFERLDTDKSGYIEPAELMIDETQWKHLSNKDVTKSTENAV